MFFIKKKGKGKGKGKFSTGKGKGRRTNPKGPDGKIMTWRKCGRTEHFQKDCPKGGGPRPGVPNGPPGNPSYFMEDIQTPTPQPLNLGCTHSTSSGARIVEIVGNTEQPLVPKKKVHFTFFNDYQDVPEETNAFKYFMVREEPENPRDPIVEQDPWEEFYQSTREARESRESNDSMFTKEQYETHMGWSKGTIFEMDATQATQGATSSSSCQNPVIPQVGTNKLTTPLWATFDNAATARGDFHGNSVRERIPVPKLYPTEVKNPDFEHVKVLVDFSARKNPMREPCT
jgi:hypothetical protein